MNQYKFASHNEFAALFNRSANSTGLVLLSEGYIREQWLSWDAITDALRIQQTKFVATVINPEDLYAGMMFDVPPRYEMRVQMIGAWFWSGSATFNGSPIGGALLLAAGETAVSVLPYVLGAATSMCAVVLPDPYMELYRSVTAPRVNLLDVDRLPVFYKCADAELDALLGSRKITQAVKIRSALATLYPFVVAEFILHFEMLTYADAVELYGLAPEGTIRAEASVEYYAKTSMALLISAFSRDTQIGVRLHNRYKTCSANAGINALDSVVFKQLLTNTGLVPGDVTRSVTIALGITVARDRQLKFDLGVTRDQLIPLNVLKLDDRITPWAVALFDGMRLVYEGQHLSTLGFAIRVRDVLRNEASALSTLSADVLKEADRIDFATTLIHNKPFAGMSSPLSEPLQVARFPMMAYLGLLYHGKALEGQEKQDWMAYNIAGVRTHVKSAHDRRRVELLATLLPLPRVLDIMKLAEAGHVNEVYAALELLGGDAVNTLYTLLWERKVTNPWFTEEKRKRVLALSAVYAKQTGDHVRSAWATRRSLLLQEISYIDDESQRKRANEKVRQFEAELEAKLAALMPVDAIIPDLSDQ